MLMGEYFLDVMIFNFKTIDVMKSTLPISIHLHYPERSTNIGISRASRTIFTNPSLRN